MLNSRCSVSICGLLNTFASRKVIFSIFSAWRISVILSLSGGRMALAGSMDRFHHAAQLFHIHLQPSKDLHGVAFTLADDAQQDVLDADIVVPQAQCFLTTVRDDVAHPWREFGVH